jgi:hypothetical protein
MVRENSKINNTYEYSFKNRRSMKFEVLAGRRGNGLTMAGGEIDIDIDIF